MAKNRIVLRLDMSAVTPLLAELTAAKVYGWPDHLRLRLEAIRDGRAVGTCCEGISRVDGSIVIVPSPELLAIVATARALNLLA